MCSQALLQLVGTGRPKADASQYMATGGTPTLLLSEDPGDCGLPIHHFRGFEGSGAMCWIMKGELEFVVADMFWVLNARAEYAEDNQIIKHQW